MPVDRPTFIESWYRVSDLTPRLLGAVNVQRQHFRGLRWYVLQNPSSNDYFRLSAPAYHFAAMLDGRRTVNGVWRVCMERFGDAAPTQGEVIDVLSRLYAANLLQGDFAPDAEELFQRHRRRKWREVRGLLTNFLFIRVPLWDPDRFLGRWVGVFGKWFTLYGFFAWAAIVGAGLWAIGGHIGDMTRQASGVLNPDNLPLLYVALVIGKLCHEMGHAFSCKHFGRQSGTGGEVHQMGIMFLVFAPLPFVDASSAWALRDKRQRIVVGASGMLVELAIASLAAILWVHTAEGTTVHAIAYNMMFIASVSTLLFNGNPLLRYDAYYILLDALEIPNLDSRSRTYVAYLVKRYLWGIRKAHDPSHGSEEKGWLAFYAVASVICRAVVFAAIILFVGSRFFSIGLLVAAILVTLWLVRPLANLFRYLATSPELNRQRMRAAMTTSAGCFALIVFVGLIRAPDRFRIEGVVEPYTYAEIHMKTDGFVRRGLDSGTEIGPGGPPLIEASSPALEAKRERLAAELHQLRIQRQHAHTTEAAAVQIMSEKVAALHEQISRNHQDLKDLHLRSPIPGTWVAPEIDRYSGRYLKQGQKIGIVADLNDLRIRAVAGQSVAARLIKETKPLVAIRVKGQPELEVAGRIETIIPAGQDRLPSAALGYAGGGATEIALEDSDGRLAAEPFFEILVIPEVPASGRLRPGQIMVLRFETSPKPLLEQGLRTLLQLFQKRFHV